MEKDGTGLYSVTESIYRGTDIVDKSVIGSNLTTVVVFIPIAMLSGMVGTILHDVSLTFMFAIFSSLIVALVFVPYLLKRRLLYQCNIPIWIYPGEDPSGNGGYRGYPGSQGS